MMPVGLSEREAVGEAPVCPGSKEPVTPSPPKASANFQQRVTTALLPASHEVRWLLSDRAVEVVPDNSQEIVRVIRMSRNRKIAFADPAMAVLPEKGFECP